MATNNYNTLIIGTCPDCGGRTSGYDAKYLCCVPCEMRERDLTGKTLD